MAWILFVGIIVICLLVPRNKIVYLIGLSYLWAIIGLNTFSSDYENYQFMYENIDTGIFRLYEPLYVFLNKICFSAGASFAVFRGIVAAIAIIVISFAIPRLTRNYNIALALLIIYPMVGFASGIRSVIPYAITIYALPYILVEERKSKMKYILCISIATLFHYSFLLYFVFLLCNIRLKAEKKCAVIFAELVVFALWMSGILHAFISKFTTHEKILYWLQIDKLERPSSVVAILLVFIGMIAIWMFYRMELPVKNKCIELNVHAHLVLYKLNNILFFVLLLLPLLVINVTFERFLQIAISGALIIFSNGLNSRHPRLKQKMIIVTIAVVFCLTFFVIVHGSLGTIIRNNMLY